MLLTNIPNIWFTGFMATGKSRVGALVAAKMHREFADTDKLIEQRTGMSVSEIFEKQGESAFRQLESEVIDELSRQNNLVISLGGGALTIPGIGAKIRRHGILVKLWANPETLSERIGRKNTRPLLASLSPEQRLTRIREMLAQREPCYAEADFSVESSDSVSIEEVADQVLDGIRVWAHKAVEVCTGSGERYPILIGNGWLHDFGILLKGLGLKDTHQFLVVTDHLIAEKQNSLLNTLCAQSGDCPHFRFRAGENQKNLTSLNRLYTFMLRRAFGRKTCLLQFGGGVVGDMAGFAAATYQRGIPFIQIPTTLLAMVDSSVGGKVAVNHPEGKNMIGAFYQPRAVAIDLQVLNTLPKEEFIAGLAEIVKYGVIYDAEFFAYLEQHADAILLRAPIHLAHIVRRSCEIKAEIVSQDEKETGIRAILNYGHTFGHAIEKITRYERFSHGIAVGLGMRVAGRLATLMNRWSHAEEMRQARLLDRLGIPRHFRVDAQEAWKAMGVDKKVERSHRVYILPRAIGLVEKVADAPESLVHQAWDAIREDRS